MFYTLPKSQQEALYLEEQDLELKAVDIGVARYRELRANSDASTMTPEQQLITRCMATLVPGIEALQRTVLEGKPMKGVLKWGYPVLSLGAEKLALITLITAVNASHEPDMTFTRMCMSVAGAVKTEREFSLFKQNAPDVYKDLSQRVKRWDTKAMYRLRIKTLANDKQWPTSVRAWVGAVLLQTLIECTDSFEHKKVHDDGRTVGVLQLRPHVLAALEKQHSECELLRPFLMPMVVPPKPWTPVNKDPRAPLNGGLGGQQASKGDGNVFNEQGGYTYHHRHLIKSGDGQPDPTTPLVVPVLDAANAIQETPFQINERIWEIMEAVWAAGGGVPGIPNADPLPLPPRPKDIDTNEDSRTAWKMAAKEVHGRNAAMVSQRKSFMHKLWIARSFRKYPVLYFPVELDWRGRIYPRPTQLHPQADDAGRALLRFAEPKKLGKDGFRWLSIHLANCLGYDKLPFDARIAEVRHLSGTLELRRWAQDPLTHRGWMEADDPWMALAATIEYVAAEADPENFESHLPISIDGSCNGLQHFSAMGRDPVGGKAVNLIPSDRPQDIYGIVAAEVNRIIEEEAEGPEPSEWCAIWRGKITRNTVKRSVMTTPYGVTLEGVRRQFIKDGHCDGMTNKWRAADYLKTIVYNAVGTVVVSARAYMDWLREVARILGEAGLPMEWTTPDGLRVQQRYLASTTRRVVTLMQEIYLRVPHPEKHIVVQDQIRGSAPNFVHSFDAAHLRMVVLECKRQGITAFQMVHDSYGTHACNVTKMGEITRQVFVQLYTRDILTEFKEDLERRTGLVLPDLPKKGDLDLSLILQSPYFFH